MKNKNYICIRDFQGGNFAVGSIENIEGWQERALGWCEADDNEELYRDLYNTGKKQVINFISELWELELVEIDNLTSDILYDINMKIEEYSSEYHKAWNKKDDLLSAENEEEKYYKEKIRTLEGVVDIIYDNLRKKEEK